MGDGLLFLVGFFLFKPSGVILKSFWSLSNELHPDNEAKEGLFNISCF